MEEVRKSTKAPKTMRTWHIKPISDYELYAEDGYRAEHITGSHCLACAYTSLVQEFGGNVDLRGLHRYGSCFQFLSVIVRQERDRVAEGDTNGTEI